MIKRNRLIRSALTFLNTFINEMHMHNMNSYLIPFSSANKRFSRGNADGLDVRPLGHWSIKGENSYDSR